MPVESDSAGCIPSYSLILLMLLCSSDYDMHETKNNMILEREKVLVENRKCIYLSTEKDGKKIKINNLKMF